MLWLKFMYDLWLLVLTQFRPATALPRVPLSGEYLALIPEAVHMLIEHSYNCGGMLQNRLRLSVMR